MKKDIRKHKTSKSKKGLLARIPFSDLLYSLYYFPGFAPPMKLSQKNQYPKRKLYTEAQGMKLERQRLRKEAVRFANQTSISLREAFVFFRLYLSAWRFYLGTHAIGRLLDRILYRLLVWKHE